MSGSNTERNADSTDARALVDPEIAPLIELLPLIDLSPETLEEARRLSKIDPRLYDESLKPTEVAIESHSPSPLMALLFDPPRTSGPRGAVLHLHGGGMVMGSADMARVSIPSIALAHDIVVLSVDYRLAPEFPFPAQLEDAEAALTWLLDHREALQIREDRIFLMGESAGGGLAAGLAIKLRDEGGPVIAGQVLTYPMLDNRTGNERDPHDHGLAGEFIWTRERNQFGWSALGTEKQLDAKRLGWFSPGRAQSLEDLPPAFVATGEIDLFRCENFEYARRLKEAGVHCEFHCYPGAIHGFDLMRRSRLARQYRADLHDWLARSIRGDTSYEKCAK